MDTTTSPPGSPSPPAVPEYGGDSEPVRAHLDIQRSVIERMASNSASCKSWCITLVSAILVVVADKDKPQFAWIAVIPAVLFFALDGYYLALERAFRESYNRFLDKLHRGSVETRDLYSVAPTGSILKHSLVALRSFSVWPMYLTLIVMIYLAKTFVI